MAAAPFGLWPYLWEGAQDLSTLVISDFKRKDKEGLRGSSRAARTAANATVSIVDIAKVEDLRELPQLRLQERFPILASVALKGFPGGSIATPFTQLALQTLSNLRKLATVDLSGCKALDSVSACAALAQCPQLKELSLPEGAKMPLAALGALAQLTRLTSLIMQYTKQLDLQGLQQLSSSLQQLQHLDLEDGDNVTDEAVVCLAQLKALTELSLAYCHPLQGSMLGQLSALSGLHKLDARSCPLTTIKGLERLPALQDLRLSALGPADVASLSALTTLTSLELSLVDLTDECSVLLRLPNLASLMVEGIYLTAPPAAGVLQQLTNLEAFKSGSLPRLLPLPNLLDLQIELMEEDEVDALVAAISRQTTLTQLVLLGEGGDGMSAQQMAQMVAPLKQLQSLLAVFDAGETSCLAACAALAELPLLRELTLRGVPQPAHLATLARCSQLEDLTLKWREDVGGDSTALLAALMCKPGMRTLCYERCASSASSADQEVLAQVAAQAGVKLW